MLIAIFLYSCVLELMLFSHHFFWRFRNAIAFGTICLVAFTAGGIFFELPLTLTGLYLIVSIYRLINLFRLLKGRMHNRYLGNVSRRTSFYMMTAAVLIMAVGYVWKYYGSENLPWLEVASYMQLVAAGFILFITARNVFKTRYRGSGIHYADGELPTVTVAIPARNETDDLTACLQSVLASDYPKLEIIVLDDCSHVRTSEIIKKFAHAGVRFVRGEEPPQEWLAKNHAYDRLTKESSGDYILFCGVDVRFNPESVRALVTHALSRKKHMVSVLPKRAKGTIQNSLIQPMRYWWELALPRRLFRRPPALSTCWLVRKKNLLSMGGFAGVSRSVTPEVLFAREFIKTDSYAFVRSHAGLEIFTTKKLADQYDTAIRTRYPELHRRPEVVMLLIGAELFIFAGPIFGLIIAVIQTNNALSWVATLSILFLTLTHQLIMFISVPRHHSLAFFTFPLAMCLELWVVHMSMFKYEFSIVKWKERNVCIPVMHTYPSLPKLPD